MKYISYINYGSSHALKKRSNTCVCEKINALQASTNIFPQRFHINSQDQSSAGCVYSSPRSEALGPKIFTIAVFAVDLALPLAQHTAVQPLAAGSTGEAA